MQEAWESLSQLSVVSMLASVDCRSLVSKYSEATGAAVRGLYAQQHTEAPAFTLTSMSAFGEYEAARLPICTMRNITAVSSQKFEVRSCCWRQWYSSVESTFGNLSA